MGFYTATEAKQTARNSARILKEINDIEETIQFAIDNHLYECDVFDTIMTDSRTSAEPSIPAQAHCAMELSTVKLHYDYETQEDPKFVKNIYCGRLDESYDEERECGDASTKDFDEFGFCGYANNGPEDKGTRKEYYKVGEILVPYGHEDDSEPIEFRIREVSDLGEVVDLEITKHGDYEDEIFSSAKLHYKDMTDWLDIYSDYGVYTDLRIDRDWNVCVRGLKESTLEGDSTTIWRPTKTIYGLNNTPVDSSGDLGDVFIQSDNDIYVMTGNGWKKQKKTYTYKDWKMPMNFGEIGTVCYNVFGNHWVKTHCGWYIVHKIYELGDVEKTPSPSKYTYYDIVSYNLITKDKDGNIIKSEPHKEYKCCHKVWKPVLYEYDWSYVPSKNFGENLDLFIYPEGYIRVKLNGEWIEATDEKHYNNIQLDDNFGEVYDIIAFNGELVPFTTYVKMEASEEYPKGHWMRVEKIFNFNELKLGTLPVEVDLKWAVKRVDLDTVGVGYNYDTTVVFSEGNASAIARLVSDKVKGVILTYGGDDYTDTIPEISFVMNTDLLSLEYWRVWKRLQESETLQDEMDQVIAYFRDERKYTISRVTNPETNKTFYWHVCWS